jgi:hypothetical protein
MSINGGDHEDKKFWVGQSVFVAVAGAGVFLGSGPPTTENYYAASVREWPLSSVAHCFFCVVCGHEVNKNKLLAFI